MTAGRGGFKRYMYYGDPPKRYEFSVVRYRRADADKVASNLIKKGFDAVVQPLGGPVGAAASGKHAVYKRRIK